MEVVHGAELLGLTRRNPVAVLLGVVGGLLPIEITLKPKIIPGLGSLGSQVFDVISCCLLLLLLSLITVTLLLFRGG